MEMSTLDVDVDVVQDVRLPLDVRLLQVGLATRTACSLE
jgi:hypothetical protein